MGRELSAFDLEVITRAAHEVGRSFSESLGDFSHLPYEATPNDLRAIARQAVLGIATLDFNAEQSHAAWVNIKRSQGWTYGEKKDPTAKTHPCLVAWKDLPFELQAKDELWVSTVKNLLNAMWRIPRQ